ncbi:MAG: PAS domain-containing protein [Roseinatronobacter sp.]|nr:PAS domain-containing protein [Roseinatronobacter sp.]
MLLTNDDLGNDVLSVLAALPHPVAVLDLSSNGQARYLNAAFSWVFGYSLSDVPTPEAWAERAYPEPAYRREIMTRMWSEIALQQAEGTISPPAEQVITTKSGAARNVMVGFALHQQFLIITFQDITKERCAEAALAEERRKTEATAFALTENMPGGAYTLILAEGTIYPEFKFLSRKIMEIFDVSSAEAAADPLILFDRIHPEDRIRWFELSANAAQTFSLFSCEARIRVKGRTRWIRAEAAPRRVNAEKTLWEGIVVDITALTDAEERLQSVLVTANAYVWHSDLVEGYVEFCSRWAALAELEDGARRLPNAGCVQKLHPEDVERVTESFRRLTSGTLDREEATFRWLLDDGRWIWLRVHAGISERDETGKPTALSAISVNITEEMNRFLATQEAQAQLREDLQRAQQRDTVAQVAGRVVHDLANLILVISGTAEMLEDADDPSGDVQVGLQRIRRAVELSSDLIGDLGTLSRPKQAPEHLDLRKMLRDGLDLVGSTRALKQQIRLEVPETDVPIWANKTELAQVIVNLAINSCESGTVAQPASVTLRALPPRTRPPERAPEAGILPEEHIPLAMFTIADTGMGIEKNVQSRMFRAHYTTKGQSGTGLGLSIVASILKSNSAALWVDSTPGKGTVMTIAWPSQPGRALASVMEGATDPKKPSRHHTQNWLLEHVTALIVDDIPDITQVLASMLESAGATVSTASDAEQARQMLTDPTQRWSVLVTDLHMPKINGYDLASLAAGLAEPVAAILVTARPQTLSKRKRTAFAAVLSKPVTSELLIQAVYKAASTTYSTEHKP